MSLHPQSIPPVPEDTARVARMAFPRGNLYLKMHDELVRSLPIMILPHSVPHGVSLRKRLGGWHW